MDVNGQQVEIGIHRGSVHGTGQITKTMVEDLTSQMQSEEPFLIPLVDVLRPREAVHGLLYPQKAFYT